MHDAEARRVLDLYSTSKRLLESAKVVRALETGIKDAIQKAEDRTVELKTQLMKARINAVKTALSLIA